MDALTNAIPHAKGWWFNPLACSYDEFIELQVLCAYEWRLESC